MLMWGSGGLWGYRVLQSQFEIYLNIQLLIVVQIRHQQYEGSTKVVSNLVEHSKVQLLDAVILKESDPDMMHSSHGE